MRNLFITMSAETDGLKGILLKVEAATANDLILDDAAAFILNRIRTRFLKEIDPDNVPWVPSQAAIRRRKSGGTGTLFDTGRLFRSIQAVGSGDSRRVVGTDVEYAPYLQKGTGKMPPRIFIGIGGNDAQLTGNYLIGKIKERLEA